MLVRADVLAAARAYVEAPNWRFGRVYGSASIAAFGSLATLATTLAARRTDRCRRDRGRARPHGLLGLAGGVLGAEGCPQQRSGVGSWVGPRSAALRPAGRPQLHGHGRVRGEGQQDADARRRHLPDRQHDQDLYGGAGLRLVAQGKIALDDPVSKYLPGLLPDGKRITIRELLSHTSGLPEFVDDPLFLAPYMRGDFGYAWTPKQMVAFAAASPLAFAPGTKFSYSSTNYVVLALLAERVGGKSYEKQLADYIFGPLKLDHTSLPASNKTLPDVHGYVGLAAGGKPDGAGNFDSAALTPAFAWSAGGIRATPRRSGLLPRPLRRQAAPCGAGRGDEGHEHDLRRLRARDHADRRP